MKIRMLVWLPLLVTSSVYASNPVLCNAAALSAREHFESQLRTAQPGSTLYIPKPFPINSSEIQEDLVPQVEVFLKNRVPYIASGQQQVREAIDLRTLQIGVVREANWHTARCSQSRSREWIYLLRLFDTARGIEIARAIMEENGLLNAIAYPQDRTNPIWSRPISTLPEAESALNRAVGRVFDLQYISSYGSLGCPDLMPCVAGRIAGRDGYAVLAPRGIYTFDAASRRIDRRPSGTSRAEILAGLNRVHPMAPNEATTSDGGDVDIVATKVAERP